MEYLRALEGSGPWSLEKTKERKKKISSQNLIAHLEFEYLELAPQARDYLICLPS